MIAWFFPEHSCTANVPLSKSLDLQLFEWSLERETVAVLSRCVAERIRRKLETSMCFVTDKAELIKRGVGVGRVMHTDTSLFYHFDSFPDSKLLSSLTACWLIFAPSNYWLPILNPQPVPYCFSLIVFDSFSSWVQALPEGARGLPPPPPPPLSIIEWRYRGKDGG